ncbi:hypothetical protein [Paraburkholderia sp. UYCP14C]|nr:hypothetical protein [Paraburkholderia sp. UYCP14C]
MANRQADLERADVDVEQRALKGDYNGEVAELSDIYTSRAASVRRAR